MAKSKKVSVDTEEKVEKKASKEEVVAVVDEEADEEEEEKKEEVVAVVDEETDEEEEEEEKKEEVVAAEEEEAEEEEVEGKKAPKDAPAPNLGWNSHKAVVSTIDNSYSISQHDIRQKIGIILTLCFHLNFTGKHS